MLQVSGAQGPKIEIAPKGRQHPIIASGYRTWQ